jgi:hypothetical protein
MTSPNDIVVDPLAPDDDLDIEQEYGGPAVELPKVLPRLRGSRVVELAWNEYQNQLLTDGKYTYQELYQADSLCTFDAWDQAREQDSAIEASKAARRPA